MNLYSYGYLNKNYDNLNYLFLVIMIIFGTLLIFYGLKYLRNRTNLRFRDFFILLFFVALLLIGIQFSNIQTNNSSSGQQTAALMRQISEDQKIPVKQIFTDSPTLNDGMTVKVADQYYTVNLNSKQTGYKLTAIKAIHPQNINYITKNNFSLNILHSEYMTLGLKLLIGFIMLVVQINLSGKSNLAQSTIIDQMQNYVLGGIIGGMIYNPAITILQFSIILLLWSIIIFGGRVLSKNSRFFKFILIGHPTTVIKDGWINVDAVLKNGMSADDLLFNLRTKNAENFRSVKDAIFERNGSLTILGQDSSRTYSVIVDGQLYSKELKKSKMSYNQLVDGLERRGRHYDVDQVFLAQITNGKLEFVLYPQFNKFQISKWIDQQIHHYYQKYRK